MDSCPVFKLHLQATFLKTVVRRFKRSSTGSFKVQGRFMTEQMMKDEKGFSARRAQNKLCLEKR